MKLASIIIPTYNREIYLKDCIESVINQTYRPIEIIVVDDGSTDNTISLLKTFEKYLNNNDKLFFYWHAQRNKGAPSARNKGFELSKGEYIVFLDSDDMLLPKKVEKQINKIRKGGYDLVYSPNKQIDGDGNFIKLSRNEPLHGSKKDYIRQAWQTMCATYKREFLEEIGPWKEDLKINQDYEFCLRAVINGGKVGYIDEPLQIFRYHSNERIGKSIYSFEKIKSKEKANRYIIALLREKKLMQGFVERNYFKKLVFCAIMYGELDRKEEQQRLISYLKSGFELTTVDYLLLRIIKNKTLRFFFYRLYRNISQ